MVDAIVLTLRHGARRLLRNPGWALVAVVMLSLGIASTTAVFSLVAGVLLKPPAYADAERLVLVSTARAEDRNQAGIFDWPELLWEDWLAGNQSFDAIAGYRWVFNFLVSDDGSEPLEGMMVSEGYFSVVGIEPELGREIADWDSEFSEEIVIGHDLWVRRFDSDPDIIGKAVQIFGSKVVVGVMPPDVRFLPSPNVASEPNYDLHAKVDFWFPIPLGMRGQPAWNVIGRLKPGVTIAAAEAEIAVLLAAHADSVPEIAGLGARLDPLLDVLNADARQLLVPLFAAAALVLLIAAGNAAALLLIRGLQRQHEYGLRTAIGAGRRRMFNLVIAESLLLALVGAVIGIALATGLVRFFALASGNAIPRLEDVSIGWPVLAFGLGTAVVACVGAGLVPAARAAGLNPVDALRLGGAKSSDSRVQRRLLAAVVMGQTALTLALLVGAGLLIKTMLNLATVQPGYDTRNLLTLSVTAIGGEWQEFHERALERVATLPGVDGAAFAWGVPLTGNAWRSRIEIEGYNPPDPSDSVIALPTRSVTSGYFDMLKQRIVAGRDFLPTDKPDSTRVAIVNETFVERYIAGGNAVGKKIWQNGSDNPPTEIIGVVGDSRTDDLTRPPAPEVYLSLWQAAANSKHLVIRSNLPIEALARSVRSTLRDIVPTVAIESIMTLEQIRSESLASRNFAMRLLIGFALIACVLTLGGVYSVLSLSVAARRREIAIRSTVGAERFHILRLVLAQGAQIVAVGAVAGILASLALSRLLQSWLFGVDAIDPTTIIGAALAFTVAALIACWLPAYRASTIEPVEALRAE